MSQSVPCRFTTTNGSFEYGLLRSAKRRRTMEIRIRPSGDIQVCVPRSFTMSTIEGFLVQRAKWIMAKAKIFHDRALIMQTRNEDSCVCLYLGKSYPVAFDQTHQPWGQVVFSEKGWIVRIPESMEPSFQKTYARDFLLKWFKARAKIVLNERVTHYAQRMDENTMEVRVRSPMSLWGSCHPTKKILHFNWKIIMAPLEVVDYVVVHELSHIRVPNHSRHFWARVEKFCPNYKIHKQWLKENSYQFLLPWDKKYADCAQGDPIGQT